MHLVTYIYTWKLKKVTSTLRFFLGYLLPFVLKLELLSPEHLGSETVSFVFPMILLASAGLTSPPIVFFYGIATQTVHIKTTQIIKKIAPKNQSFAGIIKYVQSAMHIKS